eukprot:CAMPEP_0118688406 /NCGR_PEP_ID=MMETSP0800-20121206/8904_1 /TAXON_ID=210618 ORGANISM="Striatella unipunctata, Strain CCMP2910" /NCGR_SAMPLE_ID=MMETSP0800 /ASSEMBLY_ACC=CAM_ASM_000638 /LENGTH=388 /DNA_ID=CAMNT_0006585665 /DNA_START=191 /DNA_END=1357 /DNA_ORIENTATION=-
MFVESNDENLVTVCRVYGPFERRPLFSFSPNLLVCGYYEDPLDVQTFVQDLERAEVCGRFSIDGTFNELFFVGVQVCGYYTDEDEGAEGDGQFFVRVDPNSTQAQELAGEVVCGVFDGSLIFNIDYIPFVPLCGEYDSSDPDHVEFVPLRIGGTVCGYYGADGVFVEFYTQFTETCGYYQDGEFIESVTRMEVCGFVDENGFFSQVQSEDNLDDFNTLDCDLSVESSNDDDGDDGDDVIPNDGVFEFLSRVFPYAFNFAFRDDENKFKIVFSQVIQDETRSMRQQPHDNNDNDNSNNGMRRLGRSTYNIRTHWGCNCDQEIPIADFYRRRLMMQRRLQDDSSSSAVEILQGMAEDLYWKARRSGLPFFENVSGVEFQCTGGNEYSFSV